MTKIYFINLYLSYGLEIYLTILVLHMTNSTKTTKISSIFLAAILIAGTITAVYPSFVIKGVNAQTQPYYGYNSYESGYADKKDSSYEPRYETDNNNYKKSYEDSYGPEYPSKYTDSNSYEPTTPSY